MAKVGSLLHLLGRCVTEDLRLCRTRCFVGLANLLPDFNTIATFVRPVLLRLAGAEVAYPCTIHSPIHVYDAGGLKIGRYAFINQGCRLEGRKPITIGEGALIGPFCCFENVNHRPHGSEELPVCVGAGAWIGARCVLLPGSSIGSKAVVGAGSVVRGAIPPAQLWAGTPARFRKNLVDPGEENGTPHGLDPVAAGECGTVGPSEPGRSP